MVPAKNDVVFKALFVRNTDLLKSFLASVLDIPVESICRLVVKNPELIPSVIDEKFSRLDLLIELNDEIVNIEMQVAVQKDYFKRVLFYWAREYVTGIKKGEHYSELKRTISISIMDFNVFDRPEYHTEAVVAIKGNESGGAWEVLTDDFGMHFFELKKVSSEIDPTNMKEMWLQFLRAEKEEEFEMLRQAGVMEIEQALDALEVLNADPEMREIIRMREKREHDEANIIYTARREGREEGIAIGEERGIAIGLERTIQNLKAMGVEITDEMIEKLRNTN